jgi:hypothetical protein
MEELINRHWTMWAIELISHTGESYFCLLAPTKDWCEFLRNEWEYTDHECIPVDVTLDRPEDRSRPQTNAEYNALEYWGWIDAGKDVPDMIQHAYSLFSMQFPDGSEGEENAGQGKAYRLHIQKQEEDQ